MRTSTSLRILLFLLLACPALADVLTFEEAVKEATNANPDLRVQESTLRSLDFKVQGSYYNFFPQLSASLDLNYGNSSRTFSATTPNAGSGPTLTFSPSASMNYNLFSGFADQARVSLAMANREVAQADLASLKAKVSSDLKVAYSNLVFAQDALKLGESIKERRSENYRLVSLLFDSGRENYGSVLLAKAYLEQSEFLIAQAHRAIGSASAQLAQVLGREPSDTLRASGRVPVEGLDENPDFHGLALQNPAYLKTLAQEKIALAQKTAARAAFFPSIDLVSNVGLTANGDSNSTTWLVGLSVSWSFFNGGRDYYNLKSTTQDVTTAQRSQNATLKSNISTLASTYAAYIDMTRQIKVDQAFVDALATQEKIAKEEYNNGLLNFANWDLIETGYITRQQSLLNDQRDLVKAVAAWELAKGTGVIP